MYWYSLELDLTIPMEATIRITTGGKADLSTAVTLNRIRVKRGFNHSSSRFKFLIGILIILFATMLHNTLLCKQKLYIALLTFRIKNKEIVLKKIAF